MSTPFTYLMRVRYSECDPQKVVFNGTYAEYVDLAATEYSRAMFGLEGDLFATGVDFQVVNLNISWISSAVFDDVLAIQVTTKHIGNTSYSFAFDFRRHGTDEAIATAEAIYVTVDAKAFKKMAIPDEMRANLEKGAPQILINHAGV